VAKKQPKKRPKNTGPKKPKASNGGQPKPPTSAPSEQARGRGRPRDAVKALRDLFNADPADLNITGETMSMREKAIRNLHKSLDQKDAAGFPTYQAINAGVKVLEYTDGPPSQKMEHDGEVTYRLVYDDDQPAD